MKEEEYYMITKVTLYLMAILKMEIMKDLEYYMMNII